MKPCKRCGKMILGVPDKSRGISGYDKIYNPTGPDGFGYFWPFIESDRDVCEDCDPPEPPVPGRDSNCSLGEWGYPCEQIARHSFYHERPAIRLRVSYKRRAMA